MDKLTYLTKTLSRTNRKDYENFVINAIWNKLDRDDIQPVSQQYVRNHDKGRRFIDLYFPQLNIGIECYEKFHEDQVEADEKRKVELTDVLSAINKGKYTSYEVHISKGYEAVMREIDDAVSALKDRVRELEESGELEAWNPELDARELLEGKEEISVSDKIVFRTITDASNLLFDTDYSFQQHAFFVPNGPFSDLYSGKYKVWFPKISVDGSNTRGWENILDLDGEWLYERNVDGRKLPKREHLERIIIPYVFDPVLRISGYRFMGVFKMDESKKRERPGYRAWRRVCDSFDILGDTPMAMRKVREPKKD